MDTTATFTYCSPVQHLKGMAWPDQSPVNEEDEGTCHCSYRSFGPHQRAKISDEGDLGGDRHVQLPGPLLGRAQRGPANCCFRDCQEDLHAGFFSWNIFAHTNCFQVASPLDHFGSLSRVRPFFDSSKMDHANNILSVLQRGGDLSKLGSLWRSKRDTLDFDSVM